MSAQRIDLNLSSPGADTSSLRSQDEREGEPSRQPMPDASDAARFAAAMADEGVSPTPGSRSLPVFPSLAGLPVSSTAVASEEWREPLGDALERLMVGEGRHGQQVRMELKEEVLPGVSVALEENEGRLLVTFFCRDEESRCRLAEGLPHFATTLAERLRRDVRVRVQNDDEDDPCGIDYLASVGV